MRWEWKRTKLLFFSLDVVHFPIWVTSAGEASYFWKIKNQDSCGESRPLCADIPDVQTAVVPTKLFWAMAANDDLIRSRPKTEAHSSPAMQKNTPPPFIIHSVSPLSLSFSVPLQNYSFIISHCSCSFGAALCIFSGALFLSSPSVPYILIVYL